MISKRIASRAKRRPHRRRVRAGQHCSKLPIAVRSSHHVRHRRLDGKKLCVLRIVSHLLLSGLRFGGGRWRTIRLVGASLLSLFRVSRRKKTHHVPHRIVLTIIVEPRGRHSFTILLRDTFEIRPKWRNGFWQHRTASSSSP